MARPHGAEVTMIQRCELRLAEALDERDHARIDDSEREIDVVGLERTAPLQIRRRRLIHAVGTRENVVEEREPDLCAEPPVAPVVELGEDEPRDDELLARVRDELGAGGMVRVSPVEGCEQGPRVEDEGHSGGRMGNRLRRQLGG